MFRRDFIRSWLAPPVARWFGPFRLPAGGDGNAAESYLRAFEWARTLRPDDRALLGRAVTVAVDDPGVSALIERARPALDALRAATAFDSCRWEPEIPGIDDLGKGRLDVLNGDVVRVACLSARRLVRRGQGRAALDDLFAGLTLAHRIGTGGVFFSRVIEVHEAVLVFTTAGRLLPDLDRPTRDDLARRLDALPAPEPAAATIRQEYRFIVGHVRTRLAALGPAIGADRWGDLDFDPAEAAALEKLTGGDRDRLLDHLAATESAFDDLARRVDLPRPGCRAALADFARAHRADHPIAAGLVDGAWGVRQAVDRLRAYRTLAHAALVLVRDGEPACHALRDPDGPGGFGLERRGEGWIIRSALRDEGRPEISLEVGAVP